MSEYTRALDMFVDESRVFIDQNSHQTIVLHKTGGGLYAQDTANWYASPENTGEVSTHYVIGVDGVIVQCVLEKDGAAGNCCLETGHDVFWDSYQARYVNLNLCSLSIECNDASLTNSTPLTQAQKDALFPLVKHLMQKYNIPWTRIKGHFSLDPLSRKDCPGNYPWQELENFVSQQPIDTHVQQARDIWTANNVGTPTGTGIFQAWLKLYQQINLGVPVTKEIHTVNWNAKPIIYQCFSSGYHIEYDGMSHIYDVHNQLVTTI